MPLILAEATHLSDALFPDLSSEHRAESIPPIANRFVADVDPTFVEQILHISQRKRESNLHHDREADDFRRRFEIAED